MHGIVRVYVLFDEFLFLSEPHLTPVFLFLAHAASVLKHEALAFWTNHRSSFFILCCTIDSLFHFFRVHTLLESNLQLPQPFFAKLLHNSPELGFVLDVEHLGDELHELCLTVAYRSPVLHGGHIAGLLIVAVIHHRSVKQHLASYAGNLHGRFTT